MMRLSNIAAGCLLIACVSGTVGSSLATAQPMMQVSSLNGETSRGRLLGIDADHVQLSDQNGQPTSVASSDILAIAAVDLLGAATPPPRSTPWLLLETGDRLRVEPRVIDDTSVIAQWAQFPRLPPLQIPLEVCRGLVLRPAPEPVRMAHDFDAVLRRTDRSDLVRLRNGDRITGEFVNLTSERLTLTTKLGDLEPALDQVLWLAFNPELISAPARPELLIAAVLSDGSVLWLTELRSDGDIVIVTAFAGFEATLPVSVVREIRYFDTGRVALSRIGTASENVTPFLTSVREVRRDESVAGGVLRVRDQTIATGLGCISGTELSWQLGGEFRWFHSDVAIDDVADGGGAVLFEVEVDGQPRWSSPEITGSMPPLAIPAIDLAGAGTLTLKVRFGANGHVQDYADWMNPVIVRAASSQGTE